MGSSDSKCAELLHRMGWAPPQYAAEFHNRSLAEYLENQNLEVILPRHAPQRDVSMGDRKPAMYPRPSFCWEAYKMHIAMIGPSSACRKQVTDFLPKIAPVFRGPGVRLGPGREAVPYHFFDEVLHRLVLWDLPEITFKQKSEDYVRELGLLYIDCVFMLFSDKYVLTEVYTKLIVAMALHGIPFFAICTMSGEALDDKAWARLQNDFQRKDIQVRMFDPNQPETFINNLISEFYKEVTWNRDGRNSELVDGVGDDILGQTVRIKNLEKRPELNGRCGVCIGFDKEAGRYRVRLINGGVETDLALKQDCVSIVKPRLVRCMVKIHGLESKPELNGRYAFVDEFLRETERYRVFVPAGQGSAQVLALKSTNLERVDSVAGASPVKDAPTPPADGKASAVPKVRAAPKPAPAKAGADSAHFDPPAREKPLLPGEGGVAAAPRPGSGGGISAPKSTPPMPTSPSSWAGPSAAATQVRAAPKPAPAKARADGADFDFPAREKPLLPGEGRAAAAPRPGSGGGVSPPKSTPAVASSPSSWLGPTAAAAQATPTEDEDDIDPDLAHLLPKRQVEEERVEDLMSRLLAAQAEEEAPAPPRRSSGTAAATEGASPTAAAVARQTAAAAPPPRRVRLSCVGALSLRSWAVVGDVDTTEDIMDHLMDCGKIAGNINDSADSSYASVADAESSGADVLLLMNGDPATAEAALRGVSVTRLSLKAVVLHPDSDSYGPRIADLCRDAGLPVFAADVYADVVPGSGLTVAPID